MSNDPENSSSPEKSSDPANSSIPEGASDPAKDNRPATPDEAGHPDEAGDAAPQDGADEGPGWLPAVMAATALMGIVGFIVCAGSTWYLFQQRTEFAIRTLQGAYIGEIEQSLLDPNTKSAVVAEIRVLADGLEKGKYDDSQAAEIMQGLLRLPVVQWGELQVVEAFLQQSEDQQKDDYLLQISRLKRAAEQGKITAMDVDEALDPVRVDDGNSVNGYSLGRPLTDAGVAEVAHRCELVADRESIPNEVFDEVRLEVIVRRAIERAARQ
ncbi:MAG: hypothetical protein P8L85_05400 [Rubripirellula sp.]|nr:hypothetical protein [Rubripirellula sp.]